MSVKTYKTKNVQNKSVSEHFKYSEFFCPGSETLKLDPLLPRWLEALIYKLGASKAVITSGYRTPDYSVKVGGSRTDRHTKGMAADVIFYDASGKVIPPETVCCTAEDLGFIGGIAKIGATATHIDTRKISDPYWGDESKGSYNSIWNQRAGCKSFYTWFGKSKSKETLVTYKVKKAVIYRSTPFKLSGNKAGRLKKGATVKVVVGGRVSRGGVTFYKVKIDDWYYWVNKKYLSK